MRLTFIIVMVFLSLQGYSQKNFEGSILYDSYSGSGDSISYEIIFGKSKMKATWWAIKNAKKELRGYHVYDFDKDIVYRIVPRKELVQVDSLHKGSTGDELKRIEEQKTVAGYPCYKYVDKKEPEKGDILTTAIWQSDELVYIVPEKYRNKHTLSASESGNILFLQLDLTFHLGEIMGQSEKDTSNRIVATEIRSYAVPDSVFSIPASYKIVFEPIPDEEVTVEDITVEEIVSAEEPPPPPPKPPKSKTRK